MDITRHIDVNKIEIARPIDIHKLDIENSSISMMSMLIQIILILMNDCILILMNDWCRWWRHLWCIDIDYTDIDDTDIENSLQFVCRAPSRDKETRGSTGRTRLVAHDVGAWAVRTAVIPRSNKSINQKRNAKSLRPNFVSKGRAPESRCQRGWIVRT